MLVIVVVHRHRIIGCFSPLALRKSSLHGGRFLVRSNLAIREMPIKTLNLEHILWALEKGVLISLSALFKCIFHLLMWHWELHPDLQAEGGGHWAWYEFFEIFELTPSDTLPPWSPHLPIPLILLCCATPWWLSIQICEPMGGGHSYSNYHILLSISGHFLFSVVFFIWY